MLSDSQHKHETDPKSKREKGNSQFQKVFRQSGQRDNLTAVFLSCLTCITTYLPIAYEIMKSLALSKNQLGKIQNAKYTIHNTQQMQYCFSTLA